MAKPVRRSDRWGSAVVLAGLAVLLAALPATAQLTPTPPKFMEVSWEPTDRVGQGETIAGQGTCWWDEGEVPATGAFASIRRNADWDGPGAVTVDGANDSVDVADDGTFSFEIEVRQDQLPGEYRVGVMCLHDDAVFADVVGAIDVIGTDPRPAFVDVPRAFLHHEAVRTLAWYGVTLGCSQDAFCPNERVTRGQLASLLDRTLRLDPHGEGRPFPPVGDPPAPTPAPSRSRFRDVPTTHTHAGAIDRLAGLGVVQGCAEGRFCPNTGTRRDQAASLFWRTFDGRDGSDGDPGFRDVPATSVHHRAISSLASLNVMRGCEQSRFCPDRTLTRAQAARILHRMLGLGN